MLYCGAAGMPGKIEKRCENLTTGIQCTRQELNLIQDH